MRYAIIENEYFALENLRRLVEHVSPGSRLVFSSESVRESVEYFRTGATPDLVFLDIELVDGNCFQIMEQATISSPVIFTTAYDHTPSRPSASTPSITSSSPSPSRPCAAPSTAFPAGRWLLPTRTWRSASSHVSRAGALIRPGCSSHREKDIRLSTPTT